MHKMILKSEYYAGGWLPYTVLKPTIDYALP